MKYLLTLSCGIAIGLLAGTFYAQRATITALGADATSAAAYTKCADNLFNLAALSASWVDSLSAAQRENEFLKAAITARR